MAYKVGDTVRLFGHFEGLSGDFDPDEVSIVITSPDGDVTTYVHGTDVEVVRDDEGDFHLDYTFQDGDEGRWKYKWIGVDEVTLQDEQALEVVAVDAPVTYALRPDVHNIFGASNVTKWADVDNDANAHTISRRVEWALKRATDDVNDRLRGGPYEVPFDAPYPGAVIDACARLAGVLLYDSRGAQDSEDGDGTHVLSTHRDMVDKWCRSVRAGRVSIGQVQTTSDTPGVGL